MGRAALRKMRGEEINVAGLLFLALAVLGAGQLVLAF